VEEEEEKQARVHKKGPIEPHAFVSEKRMVTYSPWTPKVLVPILKEPAEKTNFYCPNPSRLRSRHTLIIVSFSGGGRSNSGKQYQIVLL
jgi:hypothetical protein